MVHSVHQFSDVWHGLGRLRIAVNGKLRQNTSDSKRRCGHMLCAWSCRSVMQKHSGKLATPGGLLAQRATLRTRYHEVHRGQAKCWRMRAGPILPLLRRSSVLARMSTTMQDVSLVGLCGMVCGVGSTGGSLGKFQTDQSVIVATFMTVAVA